MRCSSIAVHADDVLRARGDPALRVLAGLLAGGGFLYGAVMGSYGGMTAQIAYAGVKVPLLIITSTIVCLPSFWVLHLLLGLRRDFGEAMRAVLAGQATLALCLASLAPLTAVGYLSVDRYRLAVLGNGVPFLLATIGAQVTMTRRYRPLVARHPRHALTRNGWLGLYVFVAMQAAWVLRPFVGAPGLPVSFFREEAWDNAYVRIVRAIVG